MSAGVAIGIILGQMLGAGEAEEAKRASRRLTVFSVVVSVVVAGVYAAISGVVPEFYNTTGPVRRMATGLMLICAATMPLEAYASAVYFTLRSGGQALVTVIFDSGFVWAVSVPAAFIIERYTNLPILAMYAIVQCLSIIKCFIGYLFYRTGRWAANIVSEEG